MTTRRCVFAGIVALVFVASGCAPLHRSALLDQAGGNAALFGQFRAYDGHTGRAVSFGELAERCRAADVVLFGEQHSDAVCNELEAQLLTALGTQSRPVALAMEFFEADTQAALDAYLLGRLDEAAFREQTRQGRPYFLAHRPLIEFCRAAHIPVLAANAPRRLVSGFRKSSLDYADYRAGLPPTDQRWLPATNAELTGPYRDRFIEMMSSHGPGPATQPVTQPATQPTAETQPASAPVMPKEGMGAGGKMPMPPPGMPPRGMPPPGSPPPGMPPGMPPAATTAPASEPTTEPASQPASMPAAQPTLDPARMFLAQSLWDQSMAESLANFRTRFPAQRLMLIVGSFHVEQTGGTAQKFRHLRPHDRVVTVVYRGTNDGNFPFDAEDRDAGDIVIYGMTPPPEAEPAAMPRAPGPAGPASQPTATQPTSTSPSTAPATQPAQTAPGEIDAPRGVKPETLQPFGQREIPIPSVLAVNKVGRYGRTPVHTDAIEAQLVAGQFMAPTEGQTVELPDGSTRTWTRVSADETGGLHDEALQSGYAYAAVESDREQVMILDAAGHSLVYVNGEPRGGDPYGFGFVRLPVLLKAGRNELLFLVGSGELHARLVEPRAPIMLDINDPTLPDLLSGQTEDLWGAVVVINTTARPLEHARLQARCGVALRETILPDTPALSIRKVGFRVAAEGFAATSTPVPLELTLLGGDVLDHATLELPVCAPTDLHKRTFVSDIDGSVQYYAVRPMAVGADNPARPALFLSLHGASVDTLNQARCYASKSWGHIVAPTNRRPYGFDWEDWGRLDALEVLALAEQTFGTDPQRTYLTGHSMGGHGTWQIGAHYPDRFAAIAPSAGWISFWSYVGDTRPAAQSAVETLLRRATNPGDTLALSRNYLHCGIYILHGGADDNVPVEQARTMRKHLAEFHPDFTYYERPGAGHWWGNECMDWPPLFEFLKLHTRPATEIIRHIEFVTASPAISARCDWATIEQQIRSLDISKIDLTLDPESRAIRGTTDNVARLSIARSIDPNGPLTFDLDGDRIENVAWPAETGKITLVRPEGHWQVVLLGSEAPNLWAKSPQRSGPFKNAFNHRVQLVYGTHGSPAENAWALAKARFDAETFWYRGNGAFDLVPDAAFDAHAEPERNVVLYGNADGNLAWKTLLANCPVQVGAGQVRVGERQVERDDLAVLAVYPRPDSNAALVGVVGGSGLAGLRLSDRLPIFLSGVAYPDFIVLGPEVLRDGMAGVLATGFFGNEWELDPDQMAWK